MLPSKREAPMRAESLRRSAAQNSVQVLPVERRAEQHHVGDMRQRHIVIGAVDAKCRRECVSARPAHVRRPRARCRHWRGSTSGGRWHAGAGSAADSPRSTRAAARTAMRTAWIEVHHDGDAQRQALRRDAACGLRRCCKCRRGRGLRRMQVQLRAQRSEFVAEGESPACVVRRAAHRRDQLRDTFS